MAQEVAKTFGHHLRGCYTAETVTPKSRGFDGGDVCVVVSSATGGSVDTDDRGPKADRLVGDLELVYRRIYDVKAQAEFNEPDDNTGDLEVLFTSGEKPMFDEDTKHPFRALVESLMEDTNTPSHPSHHVLMKHGFEYKGHDHAYHEDRYVHPHAPKHEITVSTVKGQDGDGHWTHHYHNNGRTASQDSHGSKNLDNYLQKGHVSANTRLRRYNDESGDYEDI